MKTIDPQHDQHQGPSHVKLSRDSLAPLTATSPQPQIVATYDYTDEHGELLYQSLRYEPKDFRQRRPNGQGGWIWNLQGVERGLYHLPKLISAVKEGRQIFICEGEKDVHSLEAYGYCATTSGSTNTWKPEFAKYFEGALVILVPDNDEPGKMFMGEIANDLFDVAGSLSVVQLPGLLAKEDVTDYLESDWQGSSAKERFDALFCSSSLVEINFKDDIATYITGNVTAKPETQNNTSDPSDVDPGEGLGIISQWASEVIPQKPRWLWKGWLAQGVLHILSGQQSAGKTTWVAHVIAQLQQGKLGEREGIKVGYISLEESGDRLSGRLRVAGAESCKIALYETVRDLDKENNIIERPWMLPHDAGTLERWIEDLGLELVVIDGIGYSVKGAQDYANVGAALSALAKVAERTACAILGLTHVKKGGTTDDIEAAIGSQAWTAIPRIVWVLGRDPEDETGERRAVAISNKTNYTRPEDAAFAFAIANDEELEVGYVTNVKTSIISPQDIVAPKATSEERSERVEAKDLIRRSLADGPIESAELLSEARKEGISERTLRRARKDLGVKTSRLKDPGTGKVIGTQVALP